MRHGFMISQYRGGVGTFHNRNYYQKLTCEINKLLKRIIDDSVNTCHEIKDTAETVPINFNNIKQHIKCIIILLCTPF